MARPNASSDANGASRTRPTEPVPRTALSIEEACASLGVSWNTWSEYIAPEVKLVRVGRRQLVPVTELQRWLDKRAEGVFDR